MKTIISDFVVLTAGNIAYVPVPCRCNIHSVKAASGSDMVDAKTIVVSRGADAVNTLTCNGGLAAGGILEGVPDVTNKALIFDPESVVATEKVLKVNFEAGFLAADGEVTLAIEYDESCYVKQPADEA